MYERNIQPHFGVFILNRLGLENLSLSLTPKLEIQMLQDYLMFRLDADPVIGLWIFDANDRPRLVAGLNDLCHIPASVPVHQPPMMIMHPFRPMPPPEMVPMTHPHMQQMQPFVQSNHVQFTQQPNMLAVSTMAPQFDSNSRSSVALDPLSPGGQLMVTLVNLRLL